MNDFNISTLCTLVLNGNEGLTDNEVVGIGLILYIFGILVFRYKAIFSISLKRLESEVDTFEAKLLAMKKEHIDVDQQEEIIGKIREKTFKLTLTDRCLISSGKVIAGWRMLHHAKNIITDDVEDVIERLNIIRSRLVDLDRPEAKALVVQIDAIVKKDKDIKVKLEIIRGRLAGSKQPEAKVLAEQIESILIQEEDFNVKLEALRSNLIKSEKPEAKSLAKEIDMVLKEDAVYEKTLKALLSDGSKVYNEYRDDYFEMLHDWQNRTMWLTYVAILFISVLVWAEDNVFLLVAGGFGGLLSKLRSMIKNPDSSNDYGFSWSTLFLAPLVGALTGWAGTYLVIVMTYADIFGDGIVKALNIHCQTGLSPTLIIIALVFGYSAGLFEKMMSRVEEYAIKEKSKIDKSEDH